MIADCTDYEYTLSGHFVPGIMGALFSFIDKSFSSLYDKNQKQLAVQNGCRRMDTMTRTAAHNRFSSYCFGQYFGWGYFCCAEKPHTMS